MGDKQDQSGARQVLSGELLGDREELTLGQLCRSCGLPAERLLEYVDHGVLEPRGPEPARWRFRAVSIRRVTCAVRLQRDLGVNAAGAALALDLLEEIAALRARLGRPEP